MPKDRAYLLVPIEAAPRKTPEARPSGAWMSRATFACPDCGMVSYNPNDIAWNYRGACHKFFDLWTGSRKSWKAAPAWELN